MSVYTAGRTPVPSFLAASFFFTVWLACFSLLIQDGAEADSQMGKVPRSHKVCIWTSVTNSTHAAQISFDHGSPKPRAWHDLKAIFPVFSVVCFPPITDWVTAGHRLWRISLRRPRVGKDFVWHVRKVTVVCDGKHEYTCQKRQTWGIIQDSVPFACTRGISLKDTGDAIKGFWTLQGKGGMSGNDMESDRKSRWQDQGSQYGDGGMSYNDMEPDRNHPMNDRSSCYGKGGMFGDDMKNDRNSRWQDQDSQYSDGGMSYNDMEPDRNDPMNDRSSYYGNGGMSGNDMVNDRNSRWQDQDSQYSNGGIYGKNMRNSRHVDWQDQKSRYGKGGNSHTDMEDDKNSPSQSHSSIDGKGGVPSENVTKAEDHAWDEKISLRDNACPAPKVLVTMLFAILLAGIVF